MSWSGPRPAPPPHPPPALRPSPLLWAQDPSRSSVMLLVKEVPVTQTTPPMLSPQPCCISFCGGSCPGHALALSAIPILQFISPPAISLKACLSVVPVGFPHTSQETLLSQNQTLCYSWPSAHCIFRTQKRTTPLLLCVTIVSVALRACSVFLGPGDQSHQGAC